MTRRDEPRDDDGAILIFALIIITVVALVTGATLLQGGTNFAATVGLRNVASTAYAADAAAKLAINDLELGSTSADVATSGLPVDKNNNLIPWVYDANVDGSGCFGATGTPGSPIAKTTLDLKGVYTDSQSGVAQTASVVCSPVAGTGIFQPGPANPLTGGAGGGGTGGSGGVGPALTTLSTVAPSLSVKVLGSGGTNKFAIHGDITTAGQLQLLNGNIYTNGAVNATACNLNGNAIYADGGQTCAYTGAVSDPDAGRSPDITTVPSTLGAWSTTAPATATSPGPATSSQCTSSSKTGYFFPGYYNDAGALNAATAACSTAIFEPGTYYFDFHNNSLDPIFNANAMYAGGTGSGGSYDQWLINNTKVIGGDTTVAGLKSDPPGACANPIDRSGVNGVQFIFGGDSQMFIKGSAKVELCASSNSTQAPIAIFGLDGSSAARGQLTSGYATTTTQSNSTLAATSTGAFAFTPSGTTTLTSDIAAAGDGKIASLSHTANSTDSATLQLSGLTPSTPVPAGSILKTATLKLWHAEQVGAAASSSISPSLQIQAPGMASPTNTTAQPTQKNAANAVEEDLDLTPDLAPIVNAGKLAATTLNFVESAKKSATAQVDGATLVLTYYVPVWRGQTTTAIPGNCIVTSGSSHCDLVAGSSGSSFSGSFVVQGAAYLPGATINLQLGNLAQYISLRWGLVASQASLQSQNSFPFAYPVISIPDAGPGFGAAVTAVDLTVYLCDASKSSCVDSGNAPISGSSLALTSRVKITDPVDSNTGLVAPTAKQRQMQILSWSEQR